MKRIDEKYDILLKHANLISVSEKRPLVEYSIDIAIKGSKIVAIEKGLDGNSAKKVINCTDRFVIPGFINMHSHVQMSVFRETDKGLHLFPWLHDLIWPVEARYTPEDCYKLAQFGIAEMLRNGITTFNDMYRCGDQTYRAASRMGINAHLCKGVMNIAGDVQGEHMLEEARELEKIIPSENFLYSIHGLYTNKPEYAQAAVDYAAKHKLRFHMHFCEDIQEVNTIKKIHGVEHPTQCLEKYGFDRLPKIILAHTVILDDYDFEVLKKLGGDKVTCVHCPISNAKIGCGTSDIIRLMNDGVNVALGTDGQGTGNNMDMLELMRYTLLTQRNWRKDPLVISAYDVLKMATINGAKALGIENETGSIEVGKQADLQIYDFNSLTMFPINDALSDLVLNSNHHDIYAVITDGQIVVYKHQFLLDDEKFLIEAVKDVRRRTFKEKVRLEDTYKNLTKEQLANQK